MRAILAHARLVLDILTLKVFVWLLGRDGELLDSHLFFFDRYSDLADYHRLFGRQTKADRFASLAEMYFALAPDDDPSPLAGAMAMPRPQPRADVNAVSAQRLKPARRRPSGLVPSPLGL